MAGLAERPSRVRVADGTLEITWADGATTRAGFAALRAACPCATCQEERSKPVNPFRILTEREVNSGPLRPVRMAPVGHYAYQIAWSDGHSSGIYTLTSLRALSTVVLKDGPP